jgi:hypothetical protein
VIAVTLAAVGVIAAAIIGCDKAEPVRAYAAPKDTTPLVTSVVEPVPAAR